MEFNFIELPKFKKELKDLKTLTEKWVYFIKNVENLKIVPDNINDEGLKSAYEEANIQTWTQEELDAYDYAFMREEDDRAKYDKAEQKGVERGIEKNKEEAVIGLHQNNVSISIIALSLNMTEENVIQILKKHKKQPKY